jgi:hypothetical protein
MKAKVKEYSEIMAGLALGGAAMQMTGSMPSGFKEVTEIGIATKVASSTMKKNKFMK